MVQQPDGSRNGWGPGAALLLTDTAESHQRPNKNANVLDLWKRPDECAACGHPVKFTIKNSGHRRKFANQYTEEGNAATADEFLRPRKLDTVGNRLFRLDHSLAPSSSKSSGCPARRFYPVNTFSL